MLTTFNLIKGGSLPIQLYDLANIKRSVIKMLFSESRQLQAVHLYAKDKGSRVELPTNFSKIDQIISFYKRLNLFCLNNDDFFCKDNVNKLLPAINTNTI